MNLRNDIVRYARQKLADPAPPPSQFARAYFVSHSPRIWHPMNVGITDEADPEDGSRQKVAYVSGMLNSIHPAMRYQWDTNSHGGHFQRSMHILAPGAERDDALFGNSPQADNETDLREDEAHRYVAGQRAVRHFIGLDPAKTPYLTPVMTSKALADEAARATGGLVHEVWLNPKKLQANNAPAPVTVKDGSAILFSSPHHALSPNSDNRTHLDFNMQIQLAHTYTGDRGRQTIHNLCRFNQRYWPLLTQHADALRARSLPGAQHPHARLLGDVLADHKNLLAPSHEALMNAGGQVSEIYQAALRHPEEPVHRMALADTLDEHGQQDAADFFRSTLPGSEAAAKPKKFAKRNDIVRYARERLRYSAEQQPPVLTPEIGFNVNDKSQAFTDQILSGAKTIETRSAPTLHPYVGKRMGLVRTGKGKAQVVGYVTIGKPKLYTNQKSFDDDAGSHLVGDDSPFHISKTKSGSKWGYELVDVERIDPRPLVDGRGIAPNPRVARKLQKVRYSADQQPEQAPVPAAEPPPPAAPQYKDHNHPDPNASPEKLEKIYNPQGAHFIRNKMRQWVGHDVPDTDIMDMLHVPRPHADQYRGRTSFLYHPVNIDGLVENGDGPEEMFLSCIRPKGGLYQKGYGYTATMTPKKDASGTPYGYMELIEHSGDPVTGAKEFSMPHILYNHAMALHRHGVKSIQADCALIPGKYTGAVTWPKYGFDAKLKDVYKNPKELNAVYRKWGAHLAQYGEMPIGEHSLLDLLEHPDANRIWHTPTGKRLAIYKNARRYPGTFDTDPASRSMKMLRAQCEKMEAKYPPPSQGGTSNDSI